MVAKLAKVFCGLRRRGWLTDRWLATVVAVLVSFGVIGASGSCGGRGVARVHRRWGANGAGCIRTQGGIGPCSIQAGMDFRRSARHYGRRGGALTVGFGWAVNGLAWIRLGEVGCHGIEFRAVRCCKWLSGMPVQHLWRDVVDGLGRRKHSQPIYMDRDEVAC